MALLLHGAYLPAIFNLCLQFNQQFICTQAMSGFPELMDFLPWQLWWNWMSWLIWQIVSCRYWYMEALLFPFEFLLRRPQFNVGDSHFKGGGLQHWLFRVAFLWCMWILRARVGGFFNTVGKLLHFEFCRDKFFCRIFEIFFWAGYSCGITKPEIAFRH